MSLSSDLISQFVKVTKEEKKTSSETTVYGKTVEYNGSIYVQLDGSELLTPVSNTANIGPNERVMVMIKNHTATVTGNLTSPSARIITDENGNQSVEGLNVDKLIDEIAEFEIIVADKVSTTDLEVERGRIDTLVSDNADIKKRITANEGDIDNLQAEYLTVTEKLSVNEATIENLKTTKLDVTIADARYISGDELDATNAEIHNLKTTYGDFASATADDLSAIRGSINDLDVDKLSATEADLKYANIDFSNIGKAAIEHFYSTSGLIENVVVGDGTITGNLVGVTISGDLIEGNTVKADKLVIKGTDGLYYKLNTDGMTTEAEQTNQNSLDGSVIKAKSITATKISVSDLVAFGATIGGINIADGALYSGSKTSINNTTSGFYFDKDGQMQVGNSSQWIKYYKLQNGNYALSISAEQIIIASSGKNVADEITSAQNMAASVYDKVTSRGEQLVTNGNAFLGDNTNFSALLYDGSQANGSPGSFTRPEGTPANASYRTDEYIPINPDAIYECKVDMKSKYGLSTMYILVDCYDIDGKAIVASNHMYYPESLTTLAADLNPGDTVMHLTDASGWSAANQYGYRALLWNYTNSLGYTYPENTYTRNDVQLPRAGNYLTDTAIDKVTNTVTLAAVYTGQTVPAGTKVSQSNAGSTYKYARPCGNIIPAEWTTYACKFSGTDYSGTNKELKFPPGTARIKLGFLWNYNSAADQVWVTNISFTDVTSATDAKNTASTALSTANTANSTASTALNTANTAKTDAATAQHDADNAQSTASSAEERVTEAEALIKVLSENISMLVTDGNGTSLMTQTEDGWTFTTSELQTVINRTSEGLNDLTNEVGDVNNTVDILKQAVDDLGTIAEYVKIGTYEDEPCIELGEGDSDFKLLITNTRIMFMEGSGVPAYINNQSLYIKKAVVEEELHQGNFVWKVRSNGNLGLTWKGGSS